MLEKVDLSKTMDKKELKTILEEEIPRLLSGLNRAGMEWDAAYRMISGYCVTATRRSRTPS